jgi:hypothetical protein
MFLYRPSQRYVHCSQVVIRFEVRRCCGVRTVIKPVPETVEAILDEVFRCSEVEPGINCNEHQPKYQLERDWSTDIRE